jgi:hypothetical protein
MAVITVGPSGQDFTTIKAAVAASQSGDTIQIEAGTYNDQFLTIEKSITLQAVGGEVVMTEDTSPSDGKAMITEGQPGLDVTINGFDISGVSVPDSNGAAIRYEGGSLTLGQDYFHNNQEGLLGAADPNGTITIDDSEFAFNGNGQGNTHNIYVGNIATLTVENSFIHDAVVGHDIKSRAADTIITNNRITDTENQPGLGASYEIDLPNGGNATITGNTIEKGPNAQNPHFIAYGEEGQTNPGTSVNVSNNTIVNDDPSGSVAMFFNPTSTAISFDNNQVWGLTESQLAGGGPPDESGTVFLPSRPSVDTSSLVFDIGGGSGGGTPPPAAPTGAAFSPLTNSLAAAQATGGLAANTSIATAVETGGTSGDSYSYALGGSGAGAFTLTTANNAATLATGAAGDTGASGGRVFALTITATDTSNGTSSPASPLDVVVGSSGGDTVDLATLVGAASMATPTFVYGLGGKDVIDGAGMTSTLWIVGGAGADVMTGGSGVNDYLYGATRDSTPAAPDIITDFHAASDLIDLTGLGTALSYAGSLPTTTTTGQGKHTVTSNQVLPAHSIGWQASGGNTFVYVNTSASREAVGSANMKIELQGSIAVSSGNFLHH